MSLENLKKRLALDQRNLLVGTVVADGSETVTVRTAKGEIRTAAKSSGASFAAGSRVELSTDGSTVTVQGPASLAQTDGEAVYTV